MADTKSQRREQILRAAEQLFQHYGYGKTTVADIARAAEVGVGSVYLEFSSKAAIASELSLRRYDCMLETMRTTVSGTGSFAERLEALLTSQFEWLARFAEEGPHGKELLRGACSATNQAHERFHQAKEELLTGFLTQAVAAGEFALSEPRLGARLLLRMLAAYVGPGALGAHASMEEARAEVSAAADLLLRGLLCRGEAQ